MININRIKQILLSPSTEWPLIDQESQSVAETISGYLIYLLAFAAIMTFLSLAVVGQGFIFASYRMGFMAASVNAIGGAIAMLVIVWLLSLLINALASRFGGTADSTAAFRLVTYSMTAPVLSQALSILPLIGWLLAFAGSLYGIYLLYLGIPVMMKSPREKSATYTLISVIGGFVISILVSMLMGLFLPKPSGDLKLSGPGGDVTISSDKLDSFGKRIEEFSKKMEKAGESDDPQQAAKAAAESLAGLFAGKDGKTRAPLTVQALKTHVPERAGDFERKKYETATNKVLGFEVATANATYQLGNQTFSVEIMDMGAATALASMASWAATESEKENDESVEKTYRQGKRIVNEKSRKDGSSASYKVMLANGVVVDAKSRGMSLTALKQALEPFDLSGLELAQ